MTPNITQHVEFRRSNLKCNVSLGHKIKQYRGSGKYMWQRGSINSAALTLMLGFCIVLSVSILGFLYLGQVLNTAEQGADIQNLEERIVELREKQREVELEGARLRSIESIESRVNELNLVNTSQVTFLTDNPDKVAVLGR